MDILQRFRSKCNSFFSLYPSLMTLCTVLTVLLTEYLTGWGTLLLTGVILLLTGIFLFLTGVRHTFFRTVLPSFLLLCSLFLQERQYRTDGLNRLLNFRQSSGAFLDLTVCSKTLFRTGMKDSSGDLLPPPGRIPCSVTAFAFAQGEPKRPLSAKVLLILPERFRNIPLCYGMRLRAEGVLRRMDPPLLPELFDYGNYLRSRKIHYVFHPVKIHSVSTDGSLLSFFYAFRDRILSSVLKGISSPRARSLAGGMLFGCRQGLDQESKQGFLRSGLIHIFTVSGLHIGLFASGVFLLLTFLDLRRKMIPGLALVWIYGLMTGLQMPSLRALIMLSCWGLTRACLLPGGGLNALFLAGSILLILDGSQIGEAGFHYSFLCVFFLLTAGNELGRFLNQLREKERFHPEGNRSVFLLCKYKLIRNILSFLAGCFAAWVCSFILTAHHQSISIHLAAFANGVILIHAYCIFLIFTLFFLPILIWSPCGTAAGFLLEQKLFLTERISGHFADWTGNNALSAPPWYLTAAALILSWIILQFPGRKKAFFALCALGVLLLYYLFCGGSRPREEVILGSDPAQKGAFWCISLPEERFCAAGNVPDFRTAAELSQYLKKRGHNTLTLLVTSPKEGTRSEESFLADLMKTEQIVRLQRSAFSRLRRKSSASAHAGKYSAAVNTLLYEGAEPFRLRHGKMFFEIFWKKGIFSFDILQKTSKLSLKITPDGAGNEVTSLQYGNRKYILHPAPGTERKRTVKRILRDPGGILIR